MVLYFTNTPYHTSTEPPMKSTRPSTYLPLTGICRIAAGPATARPARDFGIGYGRSSGYATTRRYASNWAPPRFRFA
jgi:hypothetical protein